MAINFGLSRYKSLMRLACCVIPWLSKCHCSHTLGVWHQSSVNSTVVTLKDRNNNTILILRGLSMKQVCEPEMTEAQVKHIKLDPVPDLKTPIILRRFALLLSFCGKGYYGMQKNQYVRSIENDLLSAMLAANLITEEEYNTPLLFNYQRVSRTDKGVSAARLLVSASFPIDVSNMKEEINKHLCDQIRVMATFRTTGNFNCRFWCDSRTYSYMCPTFAFAPFTEITREDYRITPDVLEEVRRLLNMYKGTHNFHNFSSNVKPHQKRAVRKIIDVDCGQAFIRDSLEWVIIRIRGQSFMLHQIRKMIGLIMAINRGLANSQFIAEALTENYVYLPIAPGLGLVLEEQHFDNYNKKYTSDGTREPLKWDKAEESIQKFREECIITSIVNTEIQEKSMLKWLPVLHLHDYEMYSVSPEIIDKDLLKEKHSQVRSPLRYAYRRLDHHRLLEKCEKDTSSDDEDEDEGNQQVLTDS